MPKKVKLQKQIAYKYKDHDIYKYRLNIPSEIIEKLNWTGKEELEIKISGKSIVLHPATEDH